ncbi:MAG: TRAP transporter substrate-binding protein DctP [Candidatus Schekmanbacteria bacterium]|nr:TRAP transporter substrate-binding protein DctP [Candidatus Schekmanbacteria bacterium]
MSARIYSAMAITALLLAATSVPTAQADESAPVTIKFATLAPEGTVWVKSMREADRIVQERSGGRVKFKVFAGGVSGDEKDMVRKMRLGQLSAAGITGIGLAEILPSIHVLDLPFMFASNEEVDYVLDKVQKSFEQRFLDKGFVLLGFTEAGFVHFFSNIEIKSQQDFANPAVKAWSWEGDLLSEELYRAFGVNPVPLALPDVLTQLQTGMINTTYAPPAGAVALQWHSRLKYVSGIPLAWGSGGVVVSNAIWNKLTPELQAIVREEAGKLCVKLRTLTREDNRNALVALQGQGMTVIAPPSKEQLADYLKTALDVRQKLVGKLYSQQELDEVLSARDAFRAQQGAATAAS